MPAWAIGSKLNSKSCHVTFNSAKWKLWSRNLSNCLTLNPTFFNLNWTKLDVMKYKPYAFFRNLCALCLSMHVLLLLSCVHTLVLGLDLGNSLDQREGESTQALINGSQSFRKKADSLYRYLTTPIHQILLPFQPVDNLNESYLLGTISIMFCSFTVYMPTATGDL